MPESLIHSSDASPRVRSGIEKLLATGNPLPALGDEELRRFVSVAEISLFAIEILRSFGEGWALVRGLPTPPPSDDLDQKLALRRDYALRQLDIIVRDAADGEPIEDLMSRLSVNACHSIEWAIELASKKLSPAYGLPATESPEGHEFAPGFCVLGMGKLGAGELNFSSDIDLIFVYEHDGQTSGGTRGKLENAVWYSRLAENIIDLLSSRMISPFGYRVDMRLRPEGKNGPLVRSIASTVSYYERDGAAWERQALIKAAPVAGDLRAGSELLVRLRPFIYRRYLDRDAVEQIEGIKSRIETEARKHGTRNLKLSPGGIREIEFILQIFQLANGGRCPDIQTTATLTALDRLQDNRYLAPDEVSLLRESYLFLRMLEHRIQLSEGKQTHIVPDGEELEWLAKGMGLDSGPALEEKYREIAGRIRAFYVDRFARTKQISVTRIEEHMIDLLDEGGDTERYDKILDDLGLERGVLHDLRKMSYGSSADPPTASVRRDFIRSTAVWMPRVLSYPAPSETIKRIARVVQTYGAKSLIYQIFTDHAAVSDLVVNICSISKPLFEHLARDPSTLESLLSPGGVRRRRDFEELRGRYNELVENAPTSAIAQRFFISEQFLRVGVRFVMGMESSEDLGEELSNICEACLEDPGFSIVSLGRFGRRRLNFFSDLDLVFLAEDATQELLKEAQARIDQWSKIGLTIDTRLRPMGRTSPLLVSFDRLEKYFREEAEIWERIAWTRSRVIHGDADRINKILEQFVYSTPVSDSEVAAVFQMRERLREESQKKRKPGEVDLKRGRGGLIAAEFLSSLEMIRSGHTGTSWEESLAPYPGVEAAYRTIELVENASKIVSGKSYTGWEDETDRARISIILGRYNKSLDDIEPARESIAEAFRSAQS